MNLNNSYISNLIKKRINGLLCIEEYHKGFEIELAHNLSFCLALRHDMDLMSRELVVEFMKFEEELQVRSTCFFLLSQFSVFRKELIFLKNGGWDIQFHSQSRPFTFFTNPLRMERLYRNNLRKERASAEQLGFKCSGHAPHAIHCYLGYGPNCDWNIIERATMGSGFEWISSYRLPVMTDYGEEFLDPLPSYGIEDKKLGYASVYHTSWDDRYFFLSFRNKLLGNAVKNIADAKKNITKQISYCRQSSALCVVSLHPFQYLSKNPTYQKDLVAWLVSYCRNEDIRIITLNDIYNENKKTWPTV